MARNGIEWTNVSADTSAGTAASLAGANMLASALDNLQAPLDRYNAITQKNASEESKGNTGKFVDNIYKGIDNNLDGRMYDSTALATAGRQHKKDLLAEAARKASAGRASRARADASARNIALAKQMSGFMAPRERDAVLNYGTASSEQTMTPGTGDAVVLNEQRTVPQDIPGVQSLYEDIPLNQEIIQAPVGTGPEMNTDELFSPQDFSETTTLNPRELNFKVDMSLEDLRDRNRAETSALMNANPNASLSLMKQLRSEEKGLASQIKARDAKKKQEEIASIILGNTGSGIPVTTTQNGTPTAASITISSEENKLQALVASGAQPATLSAQNNKIDKLKADELKKTNTDARANDALDGYSAIMNLANDFSDTPDKFKDQSGRLVVKYSKNNPAIRQQLMEIADRKHAEIREPYDFNQRQLLGKAIKKQQQNEVKSYEKTDEYKQQKDAVEFLKKELVSTKGKKVSDNKIEEDYYKKFGGTSVTKDFFNEISVDSEYERKKRNNIGGDIGLIKDGYNYVSDLFRSKTEVDKAKKIENERLDALDKEYGKGKYSNKETAKTLKEYSQKIRAEELKDTKAIEKSIASVKSGAKTLVDKYNEDNPGTIIKRPAKDIAEDAVAFLMKSGIKINNRNTNAIVKKIINYESMISEEDRKVKREAQTKVLMDALDTIQFEKENKIKVAGQVKVKSTASGKN